MRQLRTLLLRKELLLKRTRPATSICELLLPALLCALLILGVSVSSTDSHPDKSYVPATMADALRTLGPKTIVPLFLENILMSSFTGNTLPPPMGIPPLGLYLGYANLASKTSKKLVAPFDGTYLAVAVADHTLLPEARTLIDRIMNHTIVAEARRALDQHPFLKQLVEQEIHKLLHDFNGTLITIDDVLSFPPVETRYFESVADLEADAINNGAIWAAIVMESIPRDGESSP